MDWGVVADANQEVWFGNEVGVARGGLLAGLCGVFFFVLGWVKHFIPFHAVDTCRCKFVEDQRFREWEEFHILFLFFPIRRSNRRSLSRLFDSPALPPAAYSEGCKSPEGLLVSILSQGSLYLLTALHIWAPQRQWDRAN